MGAFPGPPRSGRQSSPNRTRTAEFDDKKVVGVTGAVSLVHTAGHGCVILGDHAVRCWGENDYGQLGQPGRKHQAEALPVPGLSDVVELSLAPTFSCARTNGGKILCWGDNWYGQLGDGTRTERREPREVAGISDAVGIAAGGEHACAPTRRGDVYCWGYNRFRAFGGAPMVWERARKIELGPR
jgi:alpha-tubulin suppressor-like RCC1 family protein